MGSIPGPGGFHVPWNNWARVPHLLSPHAANTEAHAPWNLCSDTRKATTVRSPHVATREWSCPLQPEKAHAQQRRPSATRKIPHSCPGNVIDMVRGTLILTCILFVAVAPECHSS